MGCYTRSINVQVEEREECLDAFSTCETHLREEASLSNQLFDDLVRHCPSDLEACEPLQMGRMQEEGANARFVALLGTLGVDTPQKLFSKTGVAIETCTDVLSNPLRCDGKGRARVLEALENPPVCAWDVTDPFTGESVGEMLAVWLRENFKTPLQFRRQASECELKCRLIGTVGQLSDSDLESLLYTPTMFQALEIAAAWACLQKTEHARLAADFSHAVRSLSDVKKNLAATAA